MVCVIEGCDKPARSASAAWCPMHYHRWYRHGDPSIVKPLPGPCLVEGCGRKHQAHGWCITHYSRWRLHGSTDRFVYREALR